MYVIHSDPGDFYVNLGPGGATLVAFEEATVFASRAGALACARDLRRPTRVFTIRALVEVAPGEFADYGVDLAELDKIRTQYPANGLIERN